MERPEVTASLDRKFAERMRNENPNKFNCTILMHLTNTLELDIHLDSEIYESAHDKKKLKKWIAFHKNAKGCASAKSGSPPDVKNSLTREGIQQLKIIIGFLMQEENIIQEGIFRRTGSLARQNDLKTMICKNFTLNLENGTFNVHDCASVFKGFLAELPEPLLTEAYHPIHLQLADICNDTKLSLQTKTDRMLHVIQLVVLLLPEDNRILLQDTINMLNKIIKYESKNKMNADSLATLFAPHLICPRKLTPEQLHSISQKMSGVVSFMIRTGDKVFDVPPLVAIDIRNYFSDQIRRKTMSPTAILDESVTSDSTTVSTAYTACDRNRLVPAEHNWNPTEIELAKLYAHIHSMPESVNKRKLIKRFNKANGKGTPLRFMKSATSSVTKSGKSLGNSIKKHNFIKNLISKTPKSNNHRNSSSSGCESSTSQSCGGVGGDNGKGYDTPIRSNKAQLKMRVLFQSPIASATCTSTSSIQTSNTTPSSNHSSDGNGTKMEFQTPNTTTPLPIKSNSRLCISTVCIETEKKTDDDDDPLVAVNHPSQPPTVTNNNEIIKKTVLFKIHDNTEGDDADEDGEDDDADFSHDNDLDDEDYYSPLLDRTKTRYRSEPNLSKLLTTISPTPNHFDFVKRCATPNKQRSHFANRLIKGISLGNLRLPSVKKKSLNHFSCETAVSSSANETITSGAFKSWNDEINWTALGEHTGTGNNYVIERNSMSPITKSTQRMPKSMQESIMTPRSRKPVMLLGITNLGSSDPNQSNCYKSFTSLNEADEDDVLLENINNREISNGGRSYPGIPRSKSDSDVNTIEQNQYGSGGGVQERSGSGDISARPIMSHQNHHHTLTNEFRDYLFSRSVMTSSPADLSFSSQPDDFGSTPDIRDLSESELSESLLYCLDGNRPDDLSYVSDDDEPMMTTSVCLNKENKPNIVNVSTVSLRGKRPASQQIHDDGMSGGIGTTDIDLLSKKRVLEMGETSL